MSICALDSSELKTNREPIFWYRDCVLSCSPADVPYSSSRCPIIYTCLPPFADHDEILVKHSVTLLWCPCCVFQGCWPCSMIVDAYTINIICPECLCIWFKTTVLGSMRQRYSSDQGFCFACLRTSCCPAGPCTNTTTAGRLGQACGSQGDPPSWQGLVGAEQQVTNSRYVFGFAISSWWFHNVSLWPVP